MTRHLVKLLAASALVAGAAPAGAATVTYTSGSTIPLQPSLVPNTFDCAFDFRVANNIPGLANGQFTADFDFTAPFDGLASATVTNVIVRSNALSDIDFSFISINGVVGQFTNSGSVSSATVVDVPVSFTSNNFLRLVGQLNPGGNGTGDGLITGSLTFTASQAPGGVPEPATWALLILGFGTVGGAMRRRSRMRVAYA